MISHQTYRSGMNMLMLGVCIGCAALCIGVLFFILAYIFVQGVGYLNLDFFTGTPKPLGESGGGILNSITGTLVMVGLASLIGLPIGLGAGIFVNEYASPALGGIVRFVADVMTGIPSIVIGLFVYLVVVIKMGHFSGWAGGLSLAIIMVPIVARSSEEMLKLIPNSQREAALALGVPRWRGIFSIVLPAARRGLMTGMLLAVSRAAGETAPLVFTSLGSRFQSFDLTKEMDALPLRVYRYAIGPYDEWHHQAWAASLVLVLMVLTFNILPALLLAGSPREGTSAVVQVEQAQETNTSTIALQRMFMEDRPPVTVGRRASPMRVDGVSAFYGNFRAIKDVSIPIAANSVTAIIGPSGCGKSTLIRTLNRMHEVAPGTHVEGHVFLGEEDIYAPKTDVTGIRRRVGMVFQRPNPFPTMSIFDNVASGLRLNKMWMRKKDLEEPVERGLRHAALWDEVKDKLNQNATNLSGGQQQRLCIARALAVEPEVILMDEPCSALDPVATLRIEDLMRELVRDYTIAIVTHNMQQAARVSDKTAVMMMSDDRAGELVEFGPTRDIFTNPKDKRTEAYITGRFG